MVKTSKEVNDIYRYISVYVLFCEKREVMYGMTSEQSKNAIRWFQTHENPYEFETKELKVEIAFSDTQDSLQSLLTNVMKNCQNKVLENEGDLCYNSCK